MSGVPCQACKDPRTDKSRGWWKLNGQGPRIKCSACKGTTFRLCGTPLRQPKRGERSTPSSEWVVTENTIKRMEVRGEL